LSGAKKRASGLLADDQDAEGVGDHGRADSLAGFGGGSWAEVGGDGDDVAGLLIQRYGASSGLGGEELLEGEAGGGVFFDHGQDTFAEGAEGFHGVGVEGGSVGVAVGGEDVEDFAVRGVEDDHVFLVSAGGEEDIVGGVDGEAGAASAAAGDVVLTGEGEGCGIDHGNGVLVFEVDEEMTVVVEGGLLDGSSYVEGFDDVAGCGVEDGDVGSDVGEDVDVMGGGIVEEAVGPAAGVDRLDDLKGSESRTW